MGCGYRKQPITVTINTNYYETNIIKHKSQESVSILDRAYSNIKISQRSNSVSARSQFNNNPSVIKESIANNNCIKDEIINNDHNNYLSKSNLPNSFQKKESNDENVYLKENAIHTENEYISNLNKAETSSSKICKIKNLSNIYNNFNFDNNIILEDKEESEISSSLRTINPKISDQHHIRLDNQIMKNSEAIDYTKIVDSTKSEKEKRGYEIVPSISEFNATAINNKMPRTIDFKTIRKSKFKDIKNSSINNIFDFILDFQIITKSAYKNKPIKELKEYINNMDSSNSFIDMIILESIKEVIVLSEVNTLMMKLIIIKLTKYKETGNLENKIVTKYSFSNNHTNITLGEKKFNNLSNNSIILFTENCQENNNTKQK